MRLIVCGSREWTDYELLERVMDDVLDDVEFHWDVRPTIVQGKARGADLLARRWAKSRGLVCEDYPAEWDRYGRSAGHRRNADMLNSGVDGVVAFSTAWPATRGTAGMCRLAFDAGLPVTFVTPDGTERQFCKGDG